MFTSLLIEEHYLEDVCVCVRVCVLCCGVSKMCATAPPVRPLNETFLGGRKGVQRLGRLGKEPQLFTGRGA